MRDPTPHFPALLELLNIQSKQEATRHGAGLIVYRQDLFALIVAAQRGVLSPYRYANHFSDKVTPNLCPNDEERDAIAQNGVGKYRTKDAKKFASKLYQLFHERRQFAAHLLYTPNHRFWHLFYFDNRDTDDSRNHWKRGAHIHYVSDLWSSISLDEAWTQVTNQRVAFSNKLHLQYSEYFNVHNK